MPNGHYGFTAYQEHIFRQMMHRMESKQMKESLDIQSPDDEFRTFLVDAVAQCEEAADSGNRRQLCQQLTTVGAAAALWLSKDIRENGYRNVGG